MDERIAICVPHRDEKDYREWRESFRNQLLIPGTFMFEHRGAALCTMRNALVLQALHANADWVLFVDDDVIAPPNGLQYLLDVSHELHYPFLSGLYWAKKNKSEGKQLAAWRRVLLAPTGNEAWAEPKDAYAPISPDAGDFVEVHAVGLGFALIKTELFRKIPQPWFKWDVGGVSEDFYFCERCAEKGVYPLVCMKVACAHIGTFKILPDGTFDLLQM